MLVKGFAVFNGDGTEVLFAVDGHRTFRSDVHKTGVHFDTNDRPWERVYEPLPANAEFIGTYPMPKKITRFA